MEVLEWDYALLEAIGLFVLEKILGNSIMGNHWPTLDPMLANDGPKLNPTLANDW